METAGSPFSLGLKRVANLFSCVKSLQLMAFKLTEMDIPGTSLQGQAPEGLKIAELKFLVALSWGYRVVQVENKE